MHSMIGTAGRRVFLVQAAAAVAAACSAPSSGSSSTPGLVRACSTPADGPGLTQCLVSKVLLRVDGAAHLAVGQVMLKQFDDHTAAIVARDEKGFYALSGQCTHACTNVNICSGGAKCPAPVLDAHACDTPTAVPLATNGAAFLCPSHGSAYAADGSLINGPATTPLSAVLMVIDGDDVVVDLSRTAPPSQRVTA